MKKYIAALLAVLLGAGLTACAVGTDTRETDETDVALFTAVMPAETAPVAQIIPDAPPEPVPDFELYIADEPIPTVDGCLVTGRIPARFSNNTGKDAQVLLIPYLEKLDENGEWAEVPFRDGIGFCGTPDPLPVEGKELSWEISAIWGSLEDGQYRISCKVEPDPHLDSVRLVSGEFSLFTPENYGGLPLAPRD